MLGCTSLVVWALTAAKINRIFTVQRVASSERMDHKTVLVTGCNRGCGLVVATQLAARGATLILAVLGPAAGCEMRLNLGTFAADANEVLATEWKEFTPFAYNVVNTITIAGKALGAKGRCICANFFDPAADPVPSCKVDIPIGSADDDGLTLRMPVPCDRGEWEAGFEAFKQNDNLDGIPIISEAQDLAQDYNTMTELTDALDDAGGSFGMFCNDCETSCKGLALGASIGSGSDSGDSDSGDFGSDPEPSEDATPAPTAAPTAAPEVLRL